MEKDTLVTHIHKPILNRGIGDRIDDWSCLSFTFSQEILLIWGFHDCILLCFHTLDLSVVTQINTYAFLSCKPILLTNICLYVFLSCKPILLPNSGVHPKMLTCFSYSRMDSYRWPFISLPYKACSWFLQGTRPILLQLRFITPSHNNNC